MKTFVKRRSYEYLNWSPQIYNRYDILDFIAITILRIVYSRNDINGMRGKLVNYECVAVCIVEGDLWVSTNNIQITDADIDELIRILTIDNALIFNYVYIVTFGNGHMHAEMQLLSQLHVENKRTDFMGVSKPCCDMCRRVLDSENILYSMWHDSRVVNWEIPW